MKCRYKFLYLLLFTVGAQDAFGTLEILSGEAYLSFGVSSYTKRYKDRSILEDRNRGPLIGGIGFELSMWKNRCGPFLHFSGDWYSGILKEEVKDDSAYLYKRTETYILTMNSGLFFQGGNLKNYFIIFGGCGVNYYQMPSAERWDSDLGVGYLKEKTYGNFNGGIRTQFCRYFYVSYEFCNRKPVVSVLTFSFPFVFSRYNEQGSGGWGLSVSVGLDRGGRSIFVGIHGAGIGGWKPD
ncbi:MAG: hypothetical protein AB1393_11665 [Candidatus Edwardsbacteria bacterium]